MADVQLEHGYIKVAIKIMEALSRTRIPGEARQVFDCIIRESYGNQRKLAKLTNSQLSALTGVSRPHIVRGLSVLFNMNIITQKGNNIYGLQKNFDNWKSLPKRGTIKSKKRQKRVAQKGNKPVSKPSIKVRQPDNAVTPLQKITKAYRIKRYPELNELQEPKCTEEIAKWNANHSSRCSKEAKILMDDLGSWEEAVRCIDWVGSFMNKKELNWNLRTVINWSTDYKLKKDGENYGKSNSE